MISRLKDTLLLIGGADSDRVRLREIFQTGYDLLEAVCRGRGFLMKGGICDTDRGCAVVLDEFRAGKVGKLTLEDVPEQTKPQEASAEAAGDGENG